MLRQRGFTGSFPHFRRMGRDHVELLTFQFDRSGGGFVLEVAKCPSGGFTTYWGKTIRPQKVTAQDLHPNNRLRLGASGPGKDNWFRYDDGSSVGDVAQQLVPHLEQAEAWWRAG